ncbi:unnamed protein product, partial [marine sediment metagenome]
DVVVEEFVKGVKRCFPHALLQWEDFGKNNALRVLNRYRERTCSFNDDMQGTGAVTLAVIHSAVYGKNEKLKDQQYVIFGFGQAGYGIASTLIQGMIEEGLSISEAKERIYPIDKDGLILEGMSLNEYQKSFMRKQDVVSGWKLRQEGRVTLFDTVLNARASVIIGVSGVKDAFGEDVLSQMAKNTAIPIILILSNPTKKSECTPEQIIKATKGRCMIATGSPFPPVKINNVEKKVSQCNNMYIFPGVGLGAIISMTSKITNEMFIAAAKALASLVSSQDASQGLLLPDIKEIRKV